jgi:hypothetical protein
MLDNRGTEYLKEKIFIGLFIRPETAGLFLSLRTRANRNQNHAVGIRLLEGIPQPFADERRSIDVN